MQGCWHSSIHQFVIHQCPKQRRPEPWHAGASNAFIHPSMHSSINATSSEDLSLGMLGLSMHSSIHHPRQHQQLTRNPLESSFVRHPVIPSSRHCYPHGYIHSRSTQIHPDPPRSIHVHPDPPRSTQIQPDPPRSIPDPPRSTQVHPDPPRSTQIHPDPSVINL